MSVGTVWYVGAGPGDPELITVRGSRLLREAQFVVHDSGIAPELLDYAPACATRIEASVSEHPTEQELHAVARQVIAAARDGSRVIRLKVGDPLFFSRALEEISLVGDAGLVVQLVPGIAAPLGASAFAGVPLTPPQGSGAVVFISTLCAQSPAALDELVTRNTQTAETAGIFCSRQQLSGVVRSLLSVPHMATALSALVSRATLPEQVVIEGPLSELLLRTSDICGITEPLMLFVGDNIAWRQRLAWFERLPLYGRRLLLCRARTQAQESARLIREHGARPILLPLIEIESPSDSAAFEQCIARLSTYDWIILTSANGTEQLMQAIKMRGLDARALGAVRIAVIGPGTAKPLSRWGVVPDLVAKEHVAEGLASELLQRGSARSVLLARAEQARDALPEALRDAGINVDVVAAYRTRKLGEEQSNTLRELFECNGVDAVLLTSSSMADALASALGPDTPQLLRRTVVASIGPITSATLQRHGITVDVTADGYTVEGLLLALGRHFESQHSSNTDATRC